MNLYRYEILVLGFEYAISLKKYPIIKETEKGFWIVDNSKKNHKRFVLKTGKKRFARDTKEGALEDLLARKKAYLGYSESNVKNAKYQIQMIEDRIKGRD